MSYTALKKMRECNKKRFGKDVGPFEPDRFFAVKGFDLKSAALRFIHDRCEALCFSDDIEKSEAENSEYYGAAIKPKQIPYNMQMDINRLCLERELEHFIDSGVAEDAYNVYYCYMEMFFGRYGKSKKMIELLSEFESNGSSLLMKHRDHYSHSVYVFALGLALYETNNVYRAAFKRFYGFDVDDKNAEQDHQAANFYLEFWGLSSLFHDIGYPFELPFEQVMAYFEVDKKKRGKDTVFLAYKDLTNLTDLPVEVQDHLKTIYQPEKVFRNTNELFAYEISERLSEAYPFKENDERRETYDSFEKFMLETLTDKPSKPNEFGYFMDHAWFSATRLFYELTKPVTVDEDGKELEKPDYSGLSAIKKEHIDALTAILLHNSLYKFKIAYYRDFDEETKEKLYPALKMDWHPLAYMLMLCDELQCWDRTAYGRNSRTELHPMAAQFDFSDNNIKATYIYDADEIDKIDEYKDDYKRYLEKMVEYVDGGRKGEAPKQPTLKAYGSMYETEQSFRTDIEKIVEIGKGTDIGFTLAVKTAPVDRGSKHTYLSASSFLHLYDFAVALNARYNYQGGEKDVKTEQLEKEFEQLSLEYQLSNINQAKMFSRYLNEIGCFYTDRPVDFDMIRAFTTEQTEIVAPLEHRRWIREHISMGWSAGDLYDTADLPEGENFLKNGDDAAYRKAYREQLRMHKLAMESGATEEEIYEHYKKLPDSEKGKDVEPFNSMLRLIKKFDGLRIYQLN